MHNSACRTLPLSVNSFVPCKLNTKISRGQRIMRSTHTPNRCTQRHLLLSTSVELRRDLKTQKKTKKQTHALERKAWIIVPFRCTTIGAPLTLSATLQAGHAVGVEFMATLPHTPMHPKCLSASNASRQIQQTSLLDIFADMPAPPFQTKMLEAKGVS